MSEKWKLGKDYLYQFLSGQNMKPSHKGAEAARYLLRHAREVPDTPPGVRARLVFEPYCAICNEHTDEEAPLFWMDIGRAVEHRDAGSEVLHDGRWVCQEHWKICVCDKCQENKEVRGLIGTDELDCQSGIVLGPGGEAL